MHLGQSAALRAIALSARIGREGFGHDCDSEVVPDEFGNRPGIADLERRAVLDARRGEGSSGESLDTEPGLQPDDGLVAVILGADFLSRRKPMAVGAQTGQVLGAEGREAHPRPARPCLGHDRDIHPSIGDGLEELDRPAGTDARLDSAVRAMKAGHRSSRN